MAEYRLKEFDRLGLEVPPGGEAKVVDPQSDAAFENSKLRWEELGTEPHCSTFDFYRKALALRKQLHVAGNPERASWLVRSEGDVVVVTYSFSDRSVEIHFAVKKGTDLRIPDGKILLRSGTEGTHHPETVVVESNS